MREATGTTATAPVPVSRMVPSIEKLPVLDQLNTSSCVGHSVAEMMTHVRKVTLRSRLQIYYEARRLIGETDQDNGCYIRDAIKVIANLGAGREAWWPFDVENVKVDPPLKVDRDALLRKVFHYASLEGRNDYEHCLVQGYPFVIGFTCYDEFVNPNSNVARFGILNLPRANERVQGGHAVLVIGYHHDFRNSAWAKAAVAAGFPADQIPKRVYIVRNSWGPKWGNKGNFAVDADYFENLNLADDAWTIRNT